MKLKAIALVAALIVSSIGAAHAEGAYLGLGYGSMTIDGSNGVPTTKPTQVTLTGGYEISPNIAVEARVGLGGTADTIRYQGYNFDVKVDSYFAVHGKFSLPMSDRFSVFALAGYNTAKAAVSSGNVSVTGDSKSGGTYGVGAQFDATKNIGLRAEWLRHFSDATSINMGVYYKF